MHLYVPYWFFWHNGSVYVLLSLGCHKNQRLLLGGIMFSDFWNQSWSHYKWNREKTIFCFYGTLNIFLTCTCLINSLWNDNHLFSQTIHVKFDYIQGTSFFISNNLLLYTTSNYIYTSFRTFAFMPFTEWRVNKYWSLTISCWESMSANNYSMPKDRRDMDDELPPQLISLKAEATS